MTTPNTKKGQTTQAVLAWLCMSGPDICIHYVTEERDRGGQSDAKAVRN